VLSGSAEVLQHTAVGRMHSEHANDTVRNSNNSAPYVLASAAEEQDAAAAARIRQQGDTIGHDYIDDSPTSIHEHLQDRLATTAGLTGAGGGTNGGGTCDGDDGDGGNVRNATAQTRYVCCSMILYG
jgi:hypothetical protein